jgi:hypothetical protein
MIYDPRDIDDLEQRWPSGDDLPRFRGWVVGIGAAVTLACIAVGGWLAIQQP